MSKIGDTPVPISESTQVTISTSSIEVKGKEGTMTVAIPRFFTVTKEENRLIVAGSADDKKKRAIHGLVRSLLNNAVLGVNKKWEKRLEVHGTGYRVKAQGEDLVFEVGYSHSVVFKKMAGVDFVVEGANKVIVAGIDKQLVGEIAAKIHAIKKPDPYKGKGIRYEGEVLKLKPGKKAKAA